MLVNMLLANSPPLSVRNSAGDPNADIQLLKMYLMMGSGCLFGMMIDAESLLEWSTICSRILLYSASDPLPQFPGIGLTSEHQLLFFVEVFCIFCMWGMILRHLLLLSLALCCYTTRDLH